MQIGIDIQTLLGPHRSGLYFHSLNLLQGLQRLQSRHRYVGFFSGSPQRADLDRVRGQLPGLPMKHFRFPGRPYNLRMRFNALSRVSVFQYINNVTIPIGRNRLNSFFIPDLTTLLFPQWHLDVIRHHWKGIIDLACAHGDLIITFSEHTKRDVVTRLGIAAEKIKAIPLAAANNFTPVAFGEETARHLEHWGLTWKRYILSVGTLEPRKNHLLLLNAYRQLKDKGLTNDHKLVLAGSQGWLYEPVIAAIGNLGLTGDVRLLGHADPLHVLYSGASVMVYPSLYEGFGLPPLEAMACGTPVIASNASSLPEVVGDAAIMTDPHDPDDLAAAMARVLSDDQLREDMSRQGLARAASFSWDKTAAAIEAAYEHAYGQKVHR